MRGQASDVAQRVMPSENAMKQVVQRSRRKGQPPVPKTLAQALFTGALTTTNSGEQFLFFDSGQQVSLV